MLRHVIVIPPLVLLCSSFPPAFAADKAPSFEITYDAKLHLGPLNTRVYIMLSPAAGIREPRFGPDWFNTQPFFAVEAKDWKPGEALKIAENAVGYPGPLSELKPGSYRAQAVVRLNLDTHSLGDGEGNAYGPVATIKVGEEDNAVTKLTVEKVVPPRRFRETDRIKLVDIESPILSAFHKRPIHHRAAVILPEGLKEGEKVPTLYIIPGFGGDHFMAPMFGRSGPFAAGKDYVRVLLDPDCGTGHHVFADSAFNGPRGKALIEELIPHIEKSFPVIAQPGARLLNGHSSGGWSSLWLQVTYPDFFGGTWSTSPDPVTFADFQQVDLYSAAENVFRDRKGERRPIARRARNRSCFTTRSRSSKTSTATAASFTRLKRCSAR